MEKIIFILMLFTYSAFGTTDIQTENSLETNCLNCHKQDQIPNSLIHRRYLMKYSTNERMEEAIYKYIKDPKKPQSIMPPQFFLKFPMRKPIDLEESILRKNIREYLKMFDIKQHLILKN